MFFINMPTAIIYIGIYLIFHFNMNALYISTVTFYKPIHLLESEIKDVFIYYKFRPMESKYIDMLFVLKSGLLYA